MPTDVRSQILVEATRLFAAQGAGGTSIQEVADAVGVRKPSLLYHFESKDALHEAVLENVLARWNDTLPRLLFAATKDERFDAILDETIGFFAAEPDRARLLLREALDRPTEMRALLAKYVAPWLEAVTGSLRKGQAHGTIRADVDPEAYVVMVIQLVLGTVATATSTASLAVKGSARGKVPERLLKELKRVARAALMTDVGTEAARAAE
jgi:TetR/AcrR family transcriptional regulator